MGDKGEEIRFIAGKYVNHKGWVDLSKQPGETTVPVIVRTKHGEKQTYVYAFNVRKESDYKSRTYAEAVVKQCPDLDSKLVAVCRGFAKANIGRDIEGFGHLVFHRAEDAVKWQEGKGTKAMYRSIVFPVQEEEMSGSTMTG